MQSHRRDSAWNGFCRLFIRVFVATFFVRNTDGKLATNARMNSPFCVPTVTRSELCGGGGLIISFLTNLHIQNLT